MKAIIITFSTLMLMAFGWHQANTINEIENNESVTDIDGNTYKTVTIGEQTWMAENLNVSKFRNGDEIPEAKTNEEWIKAGNEGKPAWCYYENIPANGEKYGKLYNWYAVTDP